MSSFLYVKIPALQTDSAENLLKRYVAKGFPEVEVRIDREFLQHIESVLLFSGDEEISYRLVSCDVNNADVFKQVMDDVYCTHLPGHLTLSMVNFFGEHRYGLYIDESEAPQEDGEEIERNLLLGVADVDKVPYWIFIEHEWKNVKGAIRRQIHLHARRIEKQSWDKNDHLSILVAAVEGLA